MASLVLILLAVTAMMGTVAAILSHLFHHRLHKRLRRLPPQQQANLLLAWALLPAFAGVGAMVLLILPSALAAVGLMNDHCLIHSSHHCLLHLVGTPQIPGAGAVLGVVAAGMMVLAARKAGPMARRRRTLSTLGTISGRNDHDRNGSRPRILDITQPFAATVGLVRPRVLLSRGLVEALGVEQRAVVEAHEASHRRRRDPLRLVLGRLGTALHIPTTGRALFRALSLATEQTADEAAAQVVGDRTRVAETLVWVARLRARTAGGVGFIEGMLETRVRALLAEPRHRLATDRRLMVPTAGLVATLLAFFISPQLHHGLEALLGQLM